MDAVDGARVDWIDTRGLNEHEQKAPKLAEAPAARRTARAEAEPQAEL